MSKAPYREIVSPEAYEEARRGYTPLYEKVAHLYFGGRSFFIRFKTDDVFLMKMWEENFPSFCGDVVDGTMEIYGGKGEKLRLYDQINKRFLALNESYYGCVKFGYRVILADLLTQLDAVSVHSAAGIVEDKFFLVTGTSGAGKNTILCYMGEKYPCRFAWDDWGIIGEGGEVYRTSESAFHLDENSIRIFAKDAKPDDLLCEEGKSKKYMFPIHSLRKTLRTAMLIDPYHVNSMIILTNNDGPVTVEKVSSEQAFEAFKAPSYSFAWDCMVPYKNEHFMLSDWQWLILEKQYEKLFCRIPNLYVVNNNKQEKDKQHFLEQVEHAILGTA